MTYRNFDEILNAEQDNAQERIAFTREWFKKNYGFGATQEWLAEFSRPHDHDGLAKHFGSVRVGTSFASLYTQLVKVPEGWHILVSRKQDEKQVLLHPQHEASSAEPENRKFALLLAQIVKNGKIQQPEAAPAALGGTQAYMPADIFGDDKEAEKLQPVSAPIELEATSKTTSVSIDMSKYL